MKFRDGLRIHETPTQVLQMPVLQPNAKHPVGITCNRCGAMFNTSFSLTAHAESIHRPQAVIGGRNQ